MRGSSFPLKEGALVRMTAWAAPSGAARHLFRFAGEDLVGLVDFLVDLGVGQQREEARAAEDVADEGGQ